MPRFLSHRSNVQNHPLPFVVNPAWPSPSTIGSKSGPDSPNVPPAKGPIMTSKGQLAGYVVLIAVAGAIGAGWFYTASQSQAKLAAMQEQIANLTAENNRLNHLAAEHATRKVPEIDPELAR